MTTKIPKPLLKAIPNPSTFKSRKHTCKSCNHVLSSFTATCPNPKGKKNSQKKWKRNPGSKRNKEKAINKHWEEFISKPEY